MYWKEDGRNLDSKKKLETFSFKLSYPDELQQWQLGHLKKLIF